MISAAWSVKEKKIVLFSLQVGSRSKLGKHKRFIQPGELQGNYLNQLFRKCVSWSKMVPYLVFYFRGITCHSEMASAYLKSSHEVKIISIVLKYKRNLIFELNIWKIESPKINQVTWVGILKKWTKWNKLNVSEGISPEMNQIFSPEINQISVEISLQKWTEC